MSLIEVKGITYSHRCDATASEKLKLRHCHDSYEIILVMQGRGKYLIEGAKFAMRPRTLAIIKPLEYHCVEVDADLDYERYVIHFSSSAVVKEIAEILEKTSDTDKKESGNFYTSDSLSEMLLSLFDKFKYAEELSEPEKTTFMRLVLSEIILLLSSTGNQRIVHDEGALGSRVLTYINDYLDKNISLDTISKRFFVSKYYLCRCFKKYSGVSIHSYITHKRVLRAKQLIESGETASGAAYKVGFGDYSAFYRAYVKVLGKPPTSK